MEEEEATQQRLTDSSLTTHSLTSTASDEELLHSETLLLHSSDLPHHNAARTLRFDSTFFFSVVLFVVVNTE